MNTLSVFLYIFFCIVLCKMFKSSPILLLIAIIISSVVFVMSLEPLAPNDGLGQGIQNIK